MSDALSEPLTSTDTDIAGLDGFMLDVHRLFASELWALSTGDEFKAALGLWGRAWQQSPPGSLPDDDRVLSAFSGAGKNWKKVRDVALRGFVKCSDGRLYHKVLCEDVKRAATKKRERIARTLAATEARKKQRDDQRDDSRESHNSEQRDVEHKPNVTESHRQYIDIDKERKKKEESTPKPPRGSVACDNDPVFSAFWELYPRKDDKGRARKAWKVAARKAEPQAIVDGCRTYQFSDDPRFVPLPATWLNGERWLSEGVEKPSDPWAWVDRLDDSSPQSSTHDLEMRRNGHGTFDFAG